MSVALTTEKLPQMSIGEIVARAPRTARIFEKYQIDYCCQGNRALAKACAEKSLDPQTLIDELTHCGSNSTATAESWLDRPLHELCDHIKLRHHDYLRDELPRLTQIIDKVVAAHGDGHPELAQVQSHFRMLRAELEPHMMKEEQVLFPAIRSLEASGRSQSFPFGSLANPIRCMIHEHDGAGSELESIRQLTNNYAPPPGACPTYRVMLDSLAALEGDMHEHVHKENHILFPRAQYLEQRLSRA